MKIFLIVSAIALAGLLLWGLYVAIERVNHVGEERYRYEPLNGWNVTGTVICLLVAAGGIAISRQHGEFSNAIVGVALGACCFVLLLIRIVNRTSFALGIASSGLLLLLATFSAVIVALVLGLAWMKITEDDDAKIRRAIRNS